MQDNEKKFETARTLQWRTQQLDESEERTIHQIEQYGCKIFHIREDQERPLWSFTVGVYDTCSRPEILQIGLREDVAATLLNEAAKALRNSVDISQGRHREMVGEVECEFRPVDPKWIKHLMGWALWFYKDEEFPVLQAVFPDRENRFPEDEGFNEYFRQPMLQPGAPMGRLEHDLWASADPNSSLFDWKFEDGPHTGVYLSKSVANGKESITYVSHDIEDGAWQFLGDSMTESGGVLSCFHHPIDKDPTLKELFDLPLGWYAVREHSDAPWKRYLSPPEEDSEETKADATEH